MEFKDMSVEELEARRIAIGSEVDAEGADLNALETEIKGINAELDARKEAAAQQAEIRNAVAAGAGIVTEEFSPKQEERKMFGIDSVEYRDAWTKSLVNRALSEEESRALSSAGAVIPTMTVNAVWDKLVKGAPLLSKVDVTQFPTYVRYPKVTTNNAATSSTVGHTISASDDVIGYVDLVPQEYVKLLTVGADIDHMAIPAVHDWIVENLTGQIRAKMNVDILVGSNSGAFKGITSSVAANSSLPSSITKASVLKIMGALGAKYQAGAIWVMTSKMFYENILTLTTLNDYIINDGFDFRLFGHEVILMDEACISSKETIFYGDPKAYKVNIFKPLEIKSFETATTTNLQFRGATLADGELLDTSAFVRYAQT